MHSDNTAPRREYEQYSNNKYSSDMRKIRERRKCSLQARNLQCEPTMSTIQPDQFLWPTSRISTSMLAHEESETLPSREGMEAAAAATSRVRHRHQRQENLHRKQDYRITRRQAGDSGAMRLWTLTILVIVVSLSSICVSSNGQCLEKTNTSFERIGGVTIKDAPLTVLYQANMSQATIGHHHHSLSNLSMPTSTMPSTSRTTTATLYQISTPITAECNNRCRRSKSCRAFLVDYSRHTCWSVDSPVASGSSGQHHQHQREHQQLAFNLLDRAPAPIQLITTGERTAYFEKVCLNFATVECERAWIFERVLSYHIHGHDDKIIDDVPSRLRCEEHCLNERQFRCRSGEYDYISMQCRLSMVDRHMKPSLFRPTVASVDYFENQCAPAGQQCDAFDRYEDMDLGRAEIMRSASSSEECQQYCTQTLKAFVCRSFTWSPLTGRCYLNSANTNMVGGTDKLLPAPGLVYYQRNDCVDLRLECDTSSMTLNLRTNEPFRGRMYVRDDPHACETQGRSALTSSLNIPFQSPMGARCATRELPSRYSSVVVVQQHPLIQRKSDRYIKLVCDFQTSNKTISSHYNVIANPWTSTALINATSFAPKILLRITDKFGNDITGAKLGDELQLRIEAETESVYDMMARSVLAKSGTTDESIVLIDRDGCPADSRIFPPLKKVNKRTIIGRFDAFKFSSDVVVRFQVDVQFCLNSCPPTSCLDHSQSQLASTPSSLFNVNTQQLAPVTSSASSAQNDATGVQQGDSQQGGHLANSATTSTTSTTTSTTTSSPANDYLRPGSMNTNRQQQQQQQQQLDYTGDMPSDDYLGQVDVPNRPANQPLNSETATTNSNGYGLPATQSDQQFDSAQARDSSAKLFMSPSGGTGQQQQHHHHHHHSSKSQQKHLKQRPRPVYDNNSLVGSGSSSGPPSADNQLSGPEIAAALNQEQQQSDQNSHKRKRRRRRSTEPMPATPKHVPLQREIIVIESPSGSEGKANKQQSQKKSSFPGQNEVKSASKTLEIGHRTRHDQATTIDSSKFALNQIEQLEIRSRANNDNNNDKNSIIDGDDTKTLVCTNWTSLVFLILAFGALQLLTIFICLASWCHKRRHHHHTTESSFKQRQQNGSKTVAANYSGRQQQEFDNIVQKHQHEHQHRLY